MGREVSFGDPLCKESNITASSLLRIAMDAPGLSLEPARRK
jgi:hypothetical protein